MQYSEVYGGILPAKEAHILGKSSHVITQPVI